MPKKIFPTYLVWAVVLVGVAMAAFIILVPVLLHKDFVKQGIVRALAEQWSGAASFRSLEVFYWPRPGLVVKDLVVSAPGEFFAKAETVKVYPRLRPLLLGRVLLSRVEVDSPVMVIKSPRLAGGTGAPKSYSFDDFEKDAMSFLGAASLVAPNMRLIVKDGSMEFHNDLHSWKGAPPLLSIRRLAARAVLPPDRIFLKATAVASFADWMDLEVSGIAGAPEAEGGVKVYGLHAEKLLGALSTGAAPTVRGPDSVINADIKCRLDYSQSLEATVQSFSYSPLSGQLPFDVEIRSGGASWTNQRASFHEFDVRIGESEIFDLSGFLDYGEKPIFSVSGSSGSVALDQVFPWLASMDGVKEKLRKVTRLGGKATVNSLNVEGPLDGPEQWEVNLSGAVENLRAASDLLPGPLTVSSGRFEATHDAFTATDWQTSILDAEALVSASARDLRGGLGAVDASIEGRAGPQSVEWLLRSASPPLPLKARQTIAVPSMRVKWNRNSGAKVSGEFRVLDGPRISLDLRADKNSVSIEKLAVQDNASNAVLTFKPERKAVRFGFDGKLDKSTLNAFLDKNPILDGSVEGNATAYIVFDNPAQSSVAGDLRVKNFTPPWKMRIPVRIVDGALSASGNVVRISSSRILWDNSKDVMAEGSVHFAPAGIDLDISLATDSVEWEGLTRIWEDDPEDALNGESGGGPKHVAQASGIDWNPPPVRGVIHVHAKRYSMGTFVWEPASADVHLLGNGNVRIDAPKASLCGVDNSATINVTPDNVELNGAALASGLSLGDFLKCRLHRDDVMTGKFNFNGAVVGRGKGDAFKQSLDGRVHFYARDGRIFRMNFFSKILAVLNVTEIFRGKTPDLFGEGFAYNSVIIEGKIKNSRLILDKAVVDGASMNIFADGEVDLIGDSVNLTVVVAPLRTVDAVIHYVPIVKTILAGKLVSIPMKVTGPPMDPKVDLLPPSAVGAGLLGLMERTLTLPFELIKPILPGEKK